MNRSTSIGVVLLLAIALGAVAIWSTLPDTQPSDGKTYTLRQEWVPQMTFMGELVASRKGFFGNDFRLEIKPGGFESDPIKLVSTGVDQFGVAGAERVLKANEEGASLVVIGAANPLSPTVFVVKEASAIRGPEDFGGHTVGILSGSNTEIVYLALLKKVGADRSKIRELEISYDLPGFIEGKFDVLPAFAYDEPLSLRKQGVAIRTIDPANSDIRLIGNVYFTTRELLEKQPDIVRRFVEGVRRGWEYAFANRDESIAILGELDPQLDLEKEKASLGIAQSYFRPESYELLEIRRTDWEREVDVLKSSSYLTRSPNLDEVLHSFSPK